MRWSEWEGAAPPLSGDIILTVIGHPDRLDPLRNSLVVELSQGGYTERSSDAYHMAHAAILTYGWQGFIDDDIIPVYCSATGLTENNEHVDRALPCVYACVHRML